MKSKERGYSLIEVLIAIAILGIVIIGILTLFILGQRNVYSGKQMTHAVSTGTRVLEDLNTLSKTATLTAFGLASATTGATINYGGETFANSFIRTTTNISSTTDPSGFMQRWQDEMQNNDKFDQGVVTIIFTPTKDPTNNPPRATTGTVLRMRIFVTWREAARNRQVVLDTVKIERS